MNFNDLKQKATDTFWDGARKVSNVCEEHGEELKFAIPAALGLATGIAKGVSSIKKKNAADNHKNREFYDSRTHRWTFIRRDLKPQEQFEVARRYASGESYEEIFYRMRLLK